MDTNVAPHGGGSNAVGGVVPTTYAATAPTLAANNWPPIALHPETKQPRVRWKGRNAAPLDAAGLRREIRSFPEAACGIAMPDTALAVDVDVLDRDVVAGVLHAADATLGSPAMVRIGRAPKVMLFYGVATPGAVRSRKPHPLELFCGSCQVAVFGVHHVTKRPYHWIGRTPLDTRPEELEPRVTAAQVDAFLKAVGPILDPLRPAFMRSTRPGGTPDLPTALRGRFQAVEKAALARGLPPRRAETLATAKSMADAMHPDMGAGTRHHTMLAVTYELVRPGWWIDEIGRLVEAIAAQDPDKWSDDDWPKKAMDMAESGAAKLKEALGLGDFGG